MSRYLLRASAEADLAEIWRYSAQQWDVAQADRYFQQIIDTLEHLVASELDGQHCDEIQAGYWRRNVGSHVIFYRRASDDFDVVRILHARRDFRRHLPSVE